KARSARRRLLRAILVGRHGADGTDVRRRGSSERHASSAQSRLRSVGLRAKPDAGAPGKPPRERAPRLEEGARARRLEAHQPLPALVARARGDLRDADAKAVEIFQWNV